LVLLLSAASAEAYVGSFIPEAAPSSGSQSFSAASGGGASCSWNSQEWVTNNTAMNGNASISCWGSPAPVVTFYQYQTVLAPTDPFFLEGQFGPQVTNCGTVYDTTCSAAYNWGGWGGGVQQAWQDNVGFEISYPGFVPFGVLTPWCSVNSTGGVNGWALYSCYANSGWATTSLGAAATASSTTAKPPLSTSTNPPISGGTSPPPGGWKSIPTSQPAVAAAFADAYHHPNSPAVRRAVAALPH
jgi:hypothetical protein